MKHWKVMALAAGLWTGTAVAAELPVTATFSQPVQATDQLVVGETIWNCTGNTCVTRSAADKVRGLTGCRLMAGKFGTVTAYGTATNPLTADQLSRCNAQ